MMLKEKCSMTDGEWEERQKTRQLEMEACSKALAVLSSDDAHDLFTKTFNFVQKESSMHSERRTQASKLLSAVALKMQNPRLATLAVRVRLDAFTRVKKAIDDMVQLIPRDRVINLGMDSGKWHRNRNIITEKNGIAPTKCWIMLVQG